MVRHKGIGMNRAKKKKVELSGISSAERGGAGILTFIKQVKVSSLRIK